MKNTLVEMPLHAFSSFVRYAFIGSRNFQNDQYSDKILTRIFFKVFGHLLKCFFTDIRYSVTNVFVEVRNVLV